MNKRQNILTTMVLDLLALTSAENIFPDKIDNFDDLHKLKELNVPRRMGFIVENNITLKNVTEDDVKIIRKALVENSVIVLKNQKLSRKEQFELTTKLGHAAVLLPRFLTVKDVEPGLEDKVLRITNYDRNGNLKPVKDANGQYWHKDGDYHQNDYIATVLYADEIGAKQSNVRSTLFVDNCVMEVYPGELLKKVEHVINKIDISQIRDFRVTERDLVEFPAVLHKLLYEHPSGDGRNCIYLTDSMTITTKNDKTTANFF